MIRVARFLRAYLRPATAQVREEEVTIPRGQREVEGTLYLPLRRRGPLPSWIVLHGITIPGRRHESLVPFVRAMAASGAAVLVPDVPEWRALAVRSETARETVSAAADYLEARPEVLPGGAGIVGFSFGATHAMIAAAHPDLRHRVPVVLAFGGYFDFRRTLRCMLTGEHEWEGVRHRLDPDPYGRWIVAGNSLAGVPGMEGMSGLAEALLELALEAGRRRTFAAAPEYDALKGEIRARLSPEEQEIWDVLAPPSTTPPPDPGRARALADALADASLAMDPGLDPRPVLADLRSRLVLAHGEADQLIPFTESLRTYAALPDGVDATVTITRLYAHSTGSAAIRAAEYAREALRFVRLLHRAFRRG